MKTGARTATVVLFTVSVDRDTLVTLSKDDLVGLIEAQASQITSLAARIAELEARLSTPRKTPDNSSTPPSKGQKANLPIGRRSVVAVAPASAAH